MNPFDPPKLAWHRLRHLIVLALVAGLAWFLLESLLFRSGFYYRHLVEPQSNAGSTALVVRLARRNATLQPPTVLVFGDSRVGEGFSPAVAHDTAPGLNFINVAVPGSMPRTWYYLLRAMDRKQVAFDVVVVGIVYSPSGSGDWADWSLDPALTVPLLDLRDAREFPASFHDPWLRGRVSAAMWLPAIFMQKDVQSLLTAPLKRRRSLRRKRRWLDNIGNYRGRDAVMPELAFGPDHRVLDWTGATAEQRAALEQHLRILDQVPADNDAYARHWMGKLLELVRRHHASLVFYPLPRGPYAQILPPQPVAPPWLVALQHEPDVTVLAPDFLADLEAPEYFFDALHANSTARLITSERVARAVVATMPDATTPAEVPPRP